MSMSKLPELDATPPAFVDVGSEQMHVSVAVRLLLIWLALRNITTDWGRAAPDWKMAMESIRHPPSGSFPTQPQA